MGSKVTADPSINGKLHVTGDGRRGKESLIKDTKEYGKWHSCPPCHLFPVRCGTFCSWGRLEYHYLAWGFCQESPRWQDCRWNEWAITELLRGKLFPLCLWGRGSLVRAKSWIQVERCQLDSDCISLWSSVLTAGALFFFPPAWNRNLKKKNLCALLYFLLPWCKSILSAILLLLRNIKKHWVLCKYWTLQVVYSMYQSECTAIQDTAY